MNNKRSTREPHLPFCFSTTPNSTLKKAFGDEINSSNTNHFQTHVFACLDAKDIERKNFRGNMMFASIDQMEFKKTSRRDDLASLAYMILYLMND